MASAKDILKRIKDEEIEWVDLRFTDPKGKWQHLTMCAGVIGEDELEDGLMFDGSSIEGWKAINESDMILKPDLDAVYVDPFCATPMLIIICDIVEPSTARSTAAIRARPPSAPKPISSPTASATPSMSAPKPNSSCSTMCASKTATTASAFYIDDIELPTNTGKEYEGGNLGHRPRAKGGYFPVAPVDPLMDIRAEMVSTMLEMGLPCDKHHHEVAAAQHELGLTFGKLVETADRMQIYKYVVQQVAHAYGKTATFMPKPISTGQRVGHAHPHVDLERRQDTFAGNGYAGLSDMCLYFIGGVIKHAKSHERLHQPDHQQLQAAGAGLRSAGAAGLFGAQPFGFVPYSLRCGRQGEARRIPLPRCAGQPLPVLRSAADGRARRDPEQDPPGRSDGQEPLRSAAGRTRRSADRVRFAARSAASR